MNEAIMDQIGTHPYRHPAAGLWLLCTLPKVS